MSDRSINDLCPALQIIAHEWLAKCASDGLKVGIIVTYRSAVDQNAAKAKGLSNAAAGQSPHNVCDANGPSSWAFDYAIFEDDGTYVTDGTDERYRQAAEVGKALGLVYGGDWINFKDRDHLELNGWKEHINQQS